ncbi:hypothetical protein GCM10027425_12350 [Alteromonas gracilis]
MTHTTETLSVAEAQRLLLEKIADLRNGTTPMLNQEGADWPKLFSAAIAVKASAEYCDTHGQQPLAEVYASLGVLIMAVLRDQMREG